MAKISDKSLSSQQRLSALRQAQRLAREDLQALPEKLQQQTDQQLAKFGARLDRRLAKNAFAACDKTAYAEHLRSEKLQKFDVAQYMEQRRVNHSCVKSVFQAIHAGQPWQGALEIQKQQLQVLQQKRSDFLTKLEGEKAAFLAKHPTADESAYLAQKAQLQAQYDRKKADLAAKQEKVLAQKSQKLSARIQTLQQRIDAIDTAGQPSLPEDVLLRVEGLKMYFGGLKAVDDLTFDVKKGEIFGLIGPNGAGKTTVFNCITRFYDATGGQMYFCNKYDEVVDLRGFQVHDVIGQGISRTFQNVELVREISVLDNLLVACTRDYRSNLAVQALGLPILRQEEEVLKEKARSVLKFMGLESYAGWLAFGLPYGILKKVEIARALMFGARLIIMDEPAAGLNDTETAELTETIRRIRDEFGVTILLVEHDMSLVMNVCDTVCAISFGKMLAIGTCREIKENKAVQEAYLGIEEDGE